MPSKKQDAPLLWCFSGCKGQYVQYKNRSRQLTHLVLYNPFQNSNQVPNSTEGQVLSMDMTSTVGHVIYLDVRRVHLHLGGGRVEFHRNEPLLESTNQGSCSDFDSLDPLGKIPYRVKSLHNSSGALAVDLTPGQQEYPRRPVVSRKVSFITYWIPAVPTLTCVLNLLDENLWTILSLITRALRLVFQYIVALSHGYPRGNVCRAMASSMVYISASRSRETQCKNHGNAENGVITSEA